MPYITQTARQKLAEGGQIQTSGELNYTFTQCIKKYDGDKGLFSREGLIDALTQSIEKYISFHGKSYSVFNDVIGALDGAKLEFKRRKGNYRTSVTWTFDDVKRDFYRRVVAPYEDEKIKLNGDVY